MRRNLLIAVLLVVGLVPGITFADVFKLTSGREINGEILLSSANDLGILVKQGGGEYERVSWANFAQETLKEFATNPKLEPYVAPFIEISQEEKIKKTEVHIKPPPRLERPLPSPCSGRFFLRGSGCSLF